MWSRDAVHPRTRNARVERGVTVALRDCTKAGARAMSESSVLESSRVRALLGKLAPEERARALDGLSLFARAARELATGGPA